MFTMLQFTKLARDLKVPGCKKSTTPAAVGQSLTDPVDNTVNAGNTLNTGTQEESDGEMDLK